MDSKSMNIAVLPGSDTIFRKSFPNGSTLLAYPNQTSPAVFFQGYLPVGSLSDPAGKNGLSSLHAAMLSTGTQQHEFRHLHTLIESCGASISISSGYLYTGFSGQCLKEDLQLILGLLFEMLSQPSFPPAHFERLKQQLATIFKIQAQDTEEMAAQAFDRLYYRGHPYAIPEIGYTQTIASINLEDLQTFHSQYLGPNGMAIAFSGGMDCEETADLFEQVFSNWNTPFQQKQANLPAWQPHRQAMREHVVIPEKSQSDLIIGTSAPAGMRKEYQVCSLGNSILGQFGMMGRIGESVRERSGLAYYAASSLEAGIGPACWKVFAGVNPSNLEKAIGKIKDELKRFISEPVAQAELLDAKQQALGHLPISLESNAGIARLLISLQRYNLSLDHLRELPDILEAVSADDILTCAQKHWNLDRLVITSAGRSL
ncbi:MAG: pitrilysin family protein [Anaerolineaceae bacterium]|nr:pitrilysin family protein [Anaerolineaceae bacterium]MDD4042326.1 pitrilysin family protein [Anaerolineaceae bacterium]MDD4577745.1 pitrilysin family protein [Anaerolineaceae bacterium]